MLDTDHPVIRDYFNRPKLEIVTVEVKTEKPKREYTAGELRQLDNALNTILYEKVRRGDFSYDILYKERELIENTNRKIAWGRGVYTAKQRAWAISILDKYRTRLSMRAVEGYDNLVKKINNKIEAEANA